MIFFDHDRRGELRPSYFANSEVISAIQDVLKRRALSKREREQSDLPPVWKIPLGTDVFVALGQLSWQRCAFCERQRQDLKPYRFRPPGYAEPLTPIEGKDSYLWLAFRWSNFFPICSSCRPSQPNHFPVSGTRAGYEDPLEDSGLRLNERPLLYFPGELNEPARAFDVSRDGELIWRNRRAKATIEHFKLNISGLVEERGNSLSMLLEDLELRAIPDPSQWREFFREAPFGGCRYLYLRRLVRTIGTIKGFARAHSLTPMGVLEIVDRWKTQPEFVTVLNEAVTALAQEDSIRLVKEMKAAFNEHRRGRDRSHARIKSVEITNYKSLEEISLELPEKLDLNTSTRVAIELEQGTPEAPCLMILGENATGKSSILEAIALACLSPESVNLLKLVPQKLTLNPEYMGAGASAASVDRSEVQVTFHDKTRRGVVIEPSANAERALLHDGDREEEPLVFAYGAHRLYGKSRRSGGSRHFDTLFRDDAQITNPNAWLRTLAVENPAALDEVVSALRYIIQIDGEFDSIEVRSTGTARDGQGVILTKKRRPNDTDYILPQPLDIVSSGYRAILAVVCDILEGLIDANDGDARDARNSNAIILIDEIEAHLHPRWKLQIVSGLRRALPKATFIFTSHDPLCVRGMYNGEIVALNRYQNIDGDGLQMPERVERVDAFENVEAMTIDQLLTSDLFQLLSTDDRTVELGFARVADILAEKKSGEAVSLADDALVDRFRSEIAQALPFGRDDVQLVVQEALAEYLKERRQLDSVHVRDARDRAKKKVKEYLKGVIA